MLQEFAYRAPGTREDLFGLIAGPARILAGGTDLLVDIRAGRERPAIVVDIKRIPEYHDITWDEKEGLSIGAAARLIDVISSDAVKARYPLIAKSALHLGSPQIRNRATVVGNLCTASPAADMAPALLCLEAEVEAAGKGGSRRIPLRDFFTGVKKTRLAPGEVAERVIVPARSAGMRGDREKLKRIKGHDLALASVTVVRNEKVLRAAVGACAPTPFVVGDFDPAVSFDEVWDAVRKALSPIDDLRASRDYRLFMVETFLRRIVARLS
jgi:carbon-monoxide dehydrogenase medium subunit